MLYDFTRRLGHIVGVTSLLILVEVSHAFQPKTNSPHPPETATKHIFDPNDALKILEEAKSAGIDTDVDVNLDKAREYASHYGKYSFEEVEHMRDDLHAHRMLNHSPSDILFLERILEDELTSQLKSLKEQMPEPYLFRYPDSYDDLHPSGLFTPEVWHSFEPPSDAASPTIDTELKKQLFPMADVKKILGTGVLESVMICIVLAILMMGPEHAA